MKLRKLQIESYGSPANTIIKADGHQIGKVSSIKFAGSLKEGLYSELVIEGRVERLEFQDNPFKPASPERHNDKFRRPFFRVLWYMANFAASTSFSIQHVFAGLGYKYPLCCILQFSWEDFRGILPGIKRSRDFPGLPPGRLYVPCNQCAKKMIANRKETYGLDK